MNHTTPKRTAREAIALNAVHQCSAPGCTSPRKNISNFCTSHLIRHQRFGHPAAQPVPSSRFKMERREVALLAEANASHPAFVQARAYLENWMRQAASCEFAYSGAEQVARLVRHGVTADQVLLEVAAVWSHLQSHERLLPDDRSRDVALSRAVFKLAPAPRRMLLRATSATDSYALRPRASSLAFVGKHLREVLFVLLANVHQAVISRHERAEAAMAEMRRPLAVNAVRMLEAQAEGKSRRQFHHLPGTAP